MAIRSVASVDLVQLRGLLETVAARVSASHTHETLGGECEALGLPTPIPATEGTKHQRVSRSLAECPNDDLPEIAERMLRYVLDARMRNAIQDVLWAEPGSLPIPKRTRRDLARALDIEDLIVGGDRFTGLLDRLWVVDDDPLISAFNPSASLRWRIQQHVFHNPGDWSTEELLEQLGAFEAPDPRFARFLEGIASASVVPDEAVQRRIVDAVNPHLRAGGIELRETGSDGGYPAFSLVSTRPTSSRRPKNLIFASPTKPDIRLRDAVNNDIEIVDNPDSVLVYDREIGPDGIRWRDLQAWWQETRGIRSDDEAKYTLHHRLRDSLPETSPPQRLVFDAYYNIFRTSGPDLPALLPEVWLHWDPKTVKMRGAAALLRFRMDFLLLLPRGHRVVIEVDGAHHYASNNRPDPGRYAENMRADRDLKLSGYEVFRFGAAELTDADQARDTVHLFFTDLFRFYAVTVADLPGADLPVRS